MLKSRLCFLLLLCACPVAAQTFDDEYYPFAEYEEPRPMLVPDSALFYRAVQTAPDLYGSVTSFILPQVALRRRGQPFGSENATADGTSVPHRCFYALRGLNATEDAAPGLATTADRVGGAGGVRNFGFSDGLPLQPYRASVSFAGRNYLVGAKVSAVGELPHDWRYAAALDFRTGRDLYVDGVFTNAFTAAFRLEKHFGTGHRAALLAVVPPSVRGTRLSSVEEAFSLTGNPLYNPAWGFQNGRVRNSRVRRETVPWSAVSYRGDLSPATSLRASLSAETGTRKYSALGWYNARTPMPDNYRYLPSFALDPETEQAWRSRDLRYTQIDWDGMIAVNRLADGHAVYALEDRVERLCNLRFDAAVTSQISPQLSLDGGVSVAREAARYFKRMRDLLGGRYVADRDQYLVDDDTYSHLTENDLRHPGRTIGEGDRFGYDYRLVRIVAAAHLRAAYHADRFRAEAAAELGTAAAFRRGLMEKELFPGGRSFGRSHSLRTATYAFKASAGWSFSPRSYLGFSAAACASAPDPDLLFFQPQYNNLCVAKIVPERIFAAELNYRSTGRSVEWQASAFVTATLDGMDTRRYFDDRAGLYCDLSVVGIGRLDCGAEAAASLRLSYRWRLSLAVSGGVYKHIRNPRVTVISDTDNHAVDTWAESYMGGCFAGGTPMLTGCAEVAYFGPKGWGARLSAGYAGIRYAEPMPVRRTVRIARQGGSVPEAFDAFMRQERLPDAFTADASVYKSFAIGRSRLVASLLVRNLPGSRNTVYNGYESMRVRRITAGDAVSWWPHATRYTYAYPRTFYVTVSYSF